MSRLDDSLNAYAKVRVSVSIDARVMAQVRAAAMQRRAQARIGTRQLGLLAAAALGIALAEASVWIGLVRGVQAPRLAPLSHALLQLLFVTLRLLRIAEQLLGALLSAGAAALVSPLGSILAVGIVLSFVSFIVVRRRRRPAAARGL
jgi:hypothetical protein